MYFITFEGPEGSGKTTQIAAIAEWLSGEGYEVVRTREPGGTSIGDQIRQVIMGLDNRSLVAEAEILLFNASRAQLVREVIRPALEAGKVVLCDRFADSTMAYQGYGRGLSLEALRAIIEFATAGLTPDLTLLLDLDPNVGLQRRRSGAAEGEEWNRLDDEELAFHSRVRDGYLTLAAAEPHRWRVVDATAPREQILADLCGHLRAFLQAPTVEKTV